MKNIYVVYDDESAGRSELTVANENGYDRLLKRFRALSFLNVETGREALDYESLETNKVYTPVVAPKSAPYPPSPVETPKAKPTRSPQRVPLPRSPPRDGIARASSGTVLPRAALVSSIIDETNSVTILHSAPATGKTSLLELTAKSLRERGDDTRVIEFTVRSSDGNELKKDLLKLLGVNSISEVGSISGETWILIDDAQIGFEADLFWIIVFKDLASGRHSTGFRIVVAATYDLANQGSTPYAFAEHPHIYDLKLTEDEAESLYEGYMKEIFFAGKWPAFKDTILRLAEGHVGVLTAGINLLFQIYKNNQKKSLEQKEALAALRDHRFRVTLSRIFPCKKLMNDEQREAVTTVILNGPLGEVIDASQGTIDDKALVQVVRAGILSANGNFSCMLSQWHYCNTFYHRPAESPASLQDLIIKAAQSMSALRLKQSCDNGKFPKEAAFQHLFYEALTLQLPAHVSVCPELNTFAKDSSGNVITGELDFFVGGKLSWAIEITRKGDKINEHVSRFDPNNGKYRAIGHSAWIVVDCRGPRVKQVESKEARCTLYFAEDFQTAECKMRLQPLQSIALND